MEPTFRFGIGERLGAVGIVLGAGGVVVGVMFPLAYPDAFSPSAARFIFWVGATLISASVLFFICDLARYILIKKGVAPGMTLISIGFSLMALGAFVGTIGAMKEDGFVKLTWVEHKKPGPLASLSNPLLRERAIAMAERLRYLEQEYQSKRNQLSYEGFGRRRTMTEADKTADWHAENARTIALMDEMQGEFRNKFRSDAMILRDEFSARLKSLPMPEGRYPNGMTVRPDMQIFDKPFLAGPDPLSGGADLLEYWAKQLP
jgi:hypothetical protein